MVGRKKVAVAMSGGVDSSVAAALLKKEGFQIIGLTLDFNLEKFSGNRGFKKNIQDARQVADFLGIEHFIVDAHYFLENEVISNFCQEYICGRTPNPCIRCNEKIKFGILLNKAIKLGADYLATGHYARVKDVYDPEQKKRIYSLFKGKDIYKEQSYFLYRLSQQQLKRVIFPLGEYTKDQVRLLAKSLALPLADKQDSQEICFLCGDDYRNFILKRLRIKPKPGLIVDQKGNVLGKHKGIIYYTVGQRQGLQLALGYPVYVLRIDAQENKIVVGRRKEAGASELLVAQPHFISFLPKNKIVFKVKIRYNHPEAEAEIFNTPEGLKVHFKKPQFAITPGQSAVIYDKDMVVGGGIIEKVWDYD